MTTPVNDSLDICSFFSRPPHTCIISTLYTLLLQVSKESSFQKCAYCLTLVLEIGRSETMHYVFIVHLYEGLGVTEGGREMAWINPVYVAWQKHNQTMFEKVSPSSFLPPPPSGPLPPTPPSSSCVLQWETSLLDKSAM